MRVRSRGPGVERAGPDAAKQPAHSEELHALLERAGIQPPYLLVGHSLGGFDVRLFAERYPHDVAGIVLAESGHEEQWERLLDHRPKSSTGS